MDCGLICKIFIVFFLIYIIFISKDFFGYKKTKVTQESFKGSSTKGKDVFILYYADWCGHCQSMIPDWHIVKAALKKSAPGVLVKEVNAGDNSEIAAKENIEGFPTVILKCKNGEKKEYSGDRSAKDLEKFCVQNL